MPALHFLLNGRPWTESDAPPTMTVLDFLRGRARLTGTKEGCAEGDCGACTVVLGRLSDGHLRYQAVNSCLMMLPQIDHCAVLTVEGVAGPSGELHPAQQAMIETDATQCGFCTPGFVMAMFAFHHGGEPAHDALVHEALAGNLCRCTGYRSIVEACRRVAAGPADRFVAQQALTTDALAGLPGCNAYRVGEQILVRPQSLEELFAAQAELADAVLLAGGTDLGLRVSKDRENIPALIAVDAVKELREIRASAGALELGGAVTYTEALPFLDSHFPSFAALVRRIGSRQIRNLGTIAGNLGTASPIGDTLPCLMALGATVMVASENGERTMPVESFITGYRKTALSAGEVIRSIRIPFLQQGRQFAAYKLSKRFDQDIATVVAAFCLEERNAAVSHFRAAYGGMAPRAMRARSIEAEVLGRPWTQETLALIDDAVARDFSPITDHRGGAAFRLRAAANLLRRFQWETASRVVVRLEAL
ncbi:MAG TPA: xanthine dehydrogenase small subunit [Xanthobacteraceae bacterium]